MNTILITGSTGFVGQNLSKYLENKGFLLKSISLRDVQPPYDLHGVNSVVHLAGKAHDLKKTSVPEEYYEVNFNLTRELYKQFLKSDAKKFIFISSVKASADKVAGNLKETDAPDPQTHYGRSKLLAEQYIQSQPLPEGKSYYILRPCMIHGQGNKGNLNLLYNLISKSIPYPLAAFENRRSFLSVDNLCFVISELLKRSDIPTGVYQVADDDTLSSNELVKLIAQASGHKLKLWHISPGLIKLIAKLGDVLKLPLTTERLDKLTENYIVDNTKLLKALGKNLPMNAREGITKTIESFNQI